MTRSAYLNVAALAALFLFWLATWIVIGNEPYGPGQYYWDQAAAAAFTGIIAFYVSRHRPSPYPGFLVMQGLGFFLLAGSWVTFQVSSGSSGSVAMSQQATSGAVSDLVSDLIYASCVFLLMCGWGYLALERWHARRLSPLTTLVFVALMAGLGAIFASFYYQQYGHLLNTTLGRLCNWLGPCRVCTKMSWA